ncbi:MAG TPA: pyridoxamine 5'-phosphate oxidase family protein [Thermoplasmata archaeon]|nr:pyridoxamine 5'-phosphate oxidase family protein [Thermoplasmata archaeon]
MVVLTRDMKRVVREQRLGFVATVCPDGTPNLSPKGSTRVWDDDHLVFADALSPRTIRNLVERPAVEVNVVDPFRRRGYRFKGTGQVLRSGPEFQRIREMYKSDGADIHRIRAIVLITIKFAAPLDAPIYDSGIADAAVERSWEEYRERVRSGVPDPGHPILDL